MATTLPLMEVPFILKLPADQRGPWQQGLTTVELVQVEVFPKQGKWVLHLSSSYELEETSLETLEALLIAQVPEVKKVEWSIECSLQVTSLKFLCESHWAEIVQDITCQLPSMKGWLGTARYEVSNKELRLFVPNALGIEYFNGKKNIIERYFKTRYRLEPQIICELDTSVDLVSLAQQTETTEFEHLQQILVSQPKHGVESEKKRVSCLLGKEFKGEPVSLHDVQDEERQIIVLGQVFGIEYRKLKSGRVLLTLMITDKSDSIAGKVFLEKEQQDLDLKDGEWVKVRGSVKYDSYTSELTLMPKDMQRTAPVIRKDRAMEKRIELHLHTRMSTMDGMSSADDLIQRASHWGHEAVAITDHGVVQAFPEAIDAGAKYGVKIIMGVEGYLVDDSPGSPPINKQKSRHIILLVKNKVGLKNLYRLITASHLEFFHRQPRLPKSLLQTHREGLIIGSACEAGELIQAIIKKEPRETLKEIASFYDYLEIQPIGNNFFLLRNGTVPSEEGLREINRTVLSLGREMDKPVVATGDVHFLDPEDEAYRRIIMSGKGFSDSDDQPPLFYKTTDEMLGEFAYLGHEEALEVVVRAPKRICDEIEVLKPFPDELFTPKIPGAEEKIENMSWDRARALYGDVLPAVVEKRLNKELKAIIGNGFSVLYLIAHLLVKKSNEDGYLVGSRGSVGSSLVATMTGITEVNPLPPHYRCVNKDCLHSIWVEDGSVSSGADLQNKNCPNCGQQMDKDGHDIPFETFLGFKGEKVPDIDLNFSGDNQAQAHRFTEELFGKDNVFKAGTIATIADKTAFGYVKNYLEERKVQVRPAEMARLIKGCTGVKRTTGQHPGGQMVIPKECDVYDFTPLQRPANDQKSDIITTHFDYHSISGRLVKLDILGHDDPTAIKMLEDLTGVDALAIRLDDPLTMSLFSSPEALGVTSEEIYSKTGTFGIPEFGTKFVRQMLEDIQPKGFSDLVRTSGWSHGTDVWIGNAQELVKGGAVGISEIIACRDDIMVYLIYKGLDSSHAFKIMEGVRKGYGLKPEQIEEMRANDVPEWYIESCLKIKYMFPKAHAVAYVTMAFRIAWFKLNYPEAFYATFFTVRADEFDIEIAIQGKEFCKKIVEETEYKGKEATAKEKNMATILEIVIEMYARGITLRKVDLWESDATNFLLTKTGILPPFTSVQGLGETAARSIVTLREGQVIKSIEDLMTHAKVSKTIIEVLQNQGCFEGLAETNQFSLF
ncbi:MAG TPA: PolC-type DNA polymerase III [Desulfosporosinus sp.]|nr:PolC-type DNA polymerase III [Desulfosporosinus sp.]